MGTSIKEHSSNSDVVDISDRQRIENADAKTWYKPDDSNASNGLGIQNSDTAQANFLLEKPTFLKT